MSPSTLTGHDFIDPDKDPSVAPEIPPLTYEGFQAAIDEQRRWTDERCLKSPMIIGPRREDGLPR